MEVAPLVRRAVRILLTFFAVAIGLIALMMAAGLAAIFYEGAVQI